jgi:hypothetical protein
LVAGKNNFYAINHVKNARCSKGLPHGISPIKISYFNQMNPLPYSPLIPVKNEYTL